MTRAQPWRIEWRLPHLCPFGAKDAKRLAETPAFFVKTSWRRLLFLDLQGFWVPGGPDETYSAPSLHLSRFIPFRKGWKHEQE
ncbi:hypothetical protein RHECNPAF_890099 [Rhizobium etli CNPAF512]|nr:hypothetical protein RHECNPAF_890099 [Rhizobium etli CNPAF512]